MFDVGTGVDAVVASEVRKRLFVTFRLSKKGNCRTIRGNVNRIIAEDFRLTSCEMFLSIPKSEREGEGRFSMRPVKLYLHV